MPKNETGRQSPDLFLYFKVLYEFKAGGQQFINLTYN